MANENGVKVQEKADVELIELSDDEQADESKISAPNDSPSSLNEHNGQDEEENQSESKDSKSQQVDEETSQDEKETIDSTENENEIEDLEEENSEEMDAVEPSTETEVACIDSLISKNELSKEDYEDSQSSSTQEKSIENETEKSEQEGTVSTTESKLSEDNSAKEDKLKDVEMITIESEDENASEAQDLSVDKNKRIEDKRIEVEEVSPVEIPDEITGFPSFFRGIIDVGVTFAINRKNRNNVEIDEHSSILDCPSQVVPLVLKRMNKFPKKLDNKDKSSITPPTPASQKNMLTIPDYYASAAGKFLMGIGLSRVKQHYHRDIISKIKKQVRKEGEAEDLMEELKKQQEYYSLVRAANSPYHASLEKCEQCDFKTEFKSIMSHHMLFPHMTSRKEYKCNHCQFSCRDPKVILNHVLSLHQISCLIEALPQLYECPICSFETGVKSKATAHITRCLKGYVPERLLFAKDDFYPAITPKPITQEDIKIYEATLQALRFSNQKIMPGTNSSGVPVQNRPNLKKPIRQPVPPNPTNILNRIAPGLSQNNPSVPIATPVVAAVPTNPMAAVGNLLSNINLKNLSPQIFEMLSKSQFAAAAAKLLPTQQSISNPQLMNRGNIGTSNLLNLNLNNLNPQQAAPPSIPKQQIPQASKKPKQHVPPMPQVPPNAHALPQGANNLPPINKDGQLVMCEICDGYIKDVEQLRTHMHWIHKVKIHPKMLQNRPPLNCQKCQWRFFTDQGLERHLLGSHGLVTTNMQELVGQNKDGGRCTICGRVYNNKLVSHMNLYHKINLKPAHLSYKCTVCSATFNLYRLFESHVYLVHSSGSNKRSSEACDSSTASESAPKKKIARIENGN